MLEDGPSTSDKIDMVITPQGQVYIDVPTYKRIADLAGAAGKLPHPPTEQDLEAIAAEERAEETAREG